LYFYGLLAINNFESKTVSTVGARSYRKTMAATSETLVMMNVPE
jgi:hypothetical protein